MFYSPSYFQILQSLNQSFGDCTERTNYSFMFHSFFSSLARSRYLSLFFFFFYFQFYPVVSQNGKVYYSVGFFIFCYLLTISRSGRLAEIKWSLCILKSIIIIIIIVIIICSKNIYFISKKKKNNLLVD